MNIIDKYSDMIPSAIDYCNTNLKNFSGKTLSIKHDIKNINIFNAEANRTEHSYTITINSIVIKMLYKIINTLLYKGNQPFYSCVSLEGNYNNDKANAYLDLLVEIATKYVIYHELGHIFNGHVDFVHNNAYSNIERQVLEMDADSFSATFCVGQFTFQDTIHNFNKSQLMINNKQHALLLVIIASCIGYSVMGLGKPRNYNLNVLELRELTYLPIRTRQDYYVRSAINAFKKMNHNANLSLGNEKLDIIYFREILPNIEEYVNLFFNKLTTSDIVYSSINNNDELNDIHLEHCKYLDCIWTSHMRDKLIPYAYFELAH